MSKTNKLIRQLIPLLQGNGATRKELCRKLDLDNRTVSRYLTEIEELGFPLKKEGLNNTIYSIENNAEKLTEEDFEMFDSIGDKLESIGGFDTISTVKTFQKKILRLFGMKTEEDEIDSPYPGKHFQFLSGPNSSKNVGLAKPLAINNHTKNRSIVTIHYAWEIGRKPENLQDAITYHPYGTSTRNGRHYCVGLCEETNTVVPLYLGNIKKIKSTGRKYQETPIKVEEIYKNSFGAFIHEEPEHVVLKLNTDSIRDYLSTAYVHPTVKFTQKNGDYFLEMDVGIDGDLVSWVAGWKRSISVITPVTLFEQIASNGLNDIRFSRADYSSNEHGTRSK